MCDTAAHAVDEPRRCQLGRPLTRDSRGAQETKYVSISPEKPAILIVDDTPANLSLLVGILKSDYRTRVAISGEKALEI